MTVVASTMTDDSAQDFCRQARRLRHRLRHAPVRLHRSLRALRTDRALLPSSDPNDRFAASVAAALESGTLRYSRRLRLLREAARLGIERFEANLIIAMVEHRLRDQIEDEVEAKGSVSPWLAFLVIQTAIVVAVATLFFAIA
jgi:hypothetical protein